jgi:hypothetical protein
MACPGAHDDDAADSITRSELCCAAEQLSASQKGLYSMELVILS